MSTLKIYSKYKPFFPEDCNFTLVLIIMNCSNENVSRIKPRLVKPICSLQRLLYCSYHYLTLFIRQKNRNSKIQNGIKFHSNF